MNAFPFGLFLIFCISCVHDVVEITCILVSIKIALRRLDGVNQHDTQLFIKEKGKAVSYLSELF